MGLDISRARLNPRLDYAGVELKQGGVLLDADFNEGVAITDRRFRAAASDILGRSTVSTNTPEAFRITPAGGGLRIGRGRLYVDGLLAENHGASSDDPAKQLFDPLLAEAQFADPIDYASQPYLPDPPALPESGRHLVYLDVWDREVTHLEAPELIEPAVGVETSSRRQIVWQVRVLAARPGVTCATPDGEIEGWADLIAPSSGRLSTGTFDAPAQPDPCELPPTGGFVGVENQTYRVEIHDPGAPGGEATFKWSRDNGSVTIAAITVTSDNAVVVESLGRDDVLRLKSGDWVEILDDPRELSQRGGEIRLITVDAGERRITFSPPLPPDMLPPAFPDSQFPAVRHLRLRRWDQRGKVLQVNADGTTSVVQDLSAGSSGVINVPPPGTTLLLENGVTVSFDSVGTKSFRAGDFWIFAARTADASVEPLRSAAPRGIHHHYARLAVWDVGDRSVGDCRTPWPPAGGGHDCSCGICVTPESHASGALSIQAAVDRIRDTGGTVCLAAGRYFLREPVRIANASGLRIVGQGSRTEIAAEGTAFDLDAAYATTLESFTVGSKGQPATIRAQTVRLLRIEQVTAATFKGGDPFGTALELGGLVMFSVIRGCRFEAPIGIRTPAPDPDGGSAPPLMTAGLDVEDNVFVCEHSAVALRDDSIHAGAVRIAANRVIGPRADAFLVRGLSGPHASLSILDNDINTVGSGITAAGNGILIARNRLVCTAGAGSDDLRINGIHVEGITLQLFLLSRCQILSNHIAGFRHAGVLCSAPMRALLVKQNVIQFCGDGIFANPINNPGSASIEDNHITDIRPLGPREVGACYGIATTGWQSIDINANVVRGVARNDTLMNLRAGIAVLPLVHVKVTGNHVSDIGLRDDFLGLGTAVLIVPTPATEIDVSHNHLARDLDVVLQQSRSLFVGLAVEVIEGLAKTPLAAIAVDERRMVLFGARRPILVERPVVAGAAASGSTASVVGNVIGARGSESVARITVADSCTFTNNHCELSPGRSVTAVQVAAATIIAGGNRVLGGAPGLRLLAGASRVTVLGNIVSTTITVDDGNLGDPWKVLNLEGV